MGLVYTCNTRIITLSIITLLKVVVIYFFNLSVRAKAVLANRFYYFSPTPNIGVSSELGGGRGRVVQLLSTCACEQAVEQLLSRRPCQQNGCDVHMEGVFCCCGEEGYSVCSGKGEELIITVLVGFLGREGVSTAPSTTRPRLKSSPTPVNIPQVSWHGMSRQVQ